LNNNQRGCFSEYLFATECIKRGYQVSMPLSPASIYDCIVDNGVDLFKIQIKSTIRTPEKENLTTIHVPLQNNKRIYDQGNVDYFAVYVTLYDGFFIFKNFGNMQSVRLSLVGKYSTNFNNFVFTRDSQSHS
jgi:hypothetical protein